MDGQIPESLFQKYHVALVKALGKDAEKVFVKLSRNLSSHSKRRQDKPKRTRRRTCQLPFKTTRNSEEKIKVNIDNHTFNIEAEGCRICSANEILISQGFSEAGFLPGTYRRPKTNKRSQNGISGWSRKIRNRTLQNAAQTRIIPSSTAGSFLSIFTCSQVLINSKKVLSNT